MDDDGFRSGSDGADDRPWLRNTTGALNSRRSRKSRSGILDRHQLFLGLGHALVRPGWHSLKTMTPALVSERTRQPVQRLQPDRLVVLYRSLRKSEEDAKNEPGAADFYYGEMEMRRNVEGVSWVERLILRLYWAVSGYALRAWRSIATLAAVVLLAAVAFAFWGFPPPEADFRPVSINDNGALVYQQRPADLPSGIEQLPAAIRFSAESATALLRGPDRP